MASTAQDMLEQVLEKGGFIQDGQMSSGLINAEIRMMMRKAIC